jgi:hypothetical protein
MCVRALFFSKETCYETMLSLSLCFTLRNRQHNKMFLEDDMCAHLRSFSSKNTLQTRLYRCLLNPVSSGTVLKLYKKFYHVCAGCLIPNPNPDIFTLCHLRSSTKQDLRYCMTLSLATPFNELYTRNRLEHKPMSCVFSIAVDEIQLLLPY